MSVTAVDRFDDALAEGLAFPNSTILVSLAWKRSASSLDTRTVPARSVATDTNTATASAAARDIARLYDRVRRGSTRFSSVLPGSVLLGSNRVQFSWVLLARGSAGFGVLCGSTHP